MAKVTKLKKPEPSLLQKSISPLLIFITICVLVYVGYKVYTAIQDGIRYASRDGGVDCRSAQENLKKKGFTIDEKGHAHVKVKTVDQSSYVDKTQRYLSRSFDQGIG